MQIIDDLWLPCSAGRVLPLPDPSLVSGWFSSHPSDLSSKTLCCFQTVTRSSKEVDTTKCFCTRRPQGVRRKSSIPCTAYWRRCAAGEIFYFGKSGFPAITYADKEDFRKTDFENILKRFPDYTSLEEIFHGLLCFAKLMRPIVSWPLVFKPRLGRPSVAEPGTYIQHSFFGVVHRITKS